jgi:hypothetical protein
MAAVPADGTLRAHASGVKLTGLDLFDAAIQRTDLWLRDLMCELNWSA